MLAGTVVCLPMLSGDTAGQASLREQLNVYVLEGRKSPLVQQASELRSLMEALGEEVPDTLQTRLRYEAHSRQTNPRVAAFFGVQPRKYAVHTTNEDFMRALLDAQDISTDQGMDRALQRTRTRISGRQNALFSRDAVYPNARSHTLGVGTVIHEQAHLYFRELARQQLIVLPRGERREVLEEGVATYVSERFIHQQKYPHHGEYETYKALAARFTPSVSRTTASNCFQRRYRLSPGFLNKRVYAATHKTDLTAPVFIDVIRHFIHDLPEAYVGQECVTY